jgi:voltage-gated potassium channel
VKCDFIFGLKVLLKKCPEYVVAFCMLLSILLLSTSFQIFEREVDENMNEMPKAMWCVLITMTTVGYGDVFPITNGGRLIGILGALWAVFFVSLFTVFIHNTLLFSESQKRSFILLTRL